MQMRLVELIGKLANDELTAELLRINDEMNNIFLRYARYEKNREAGNRNTPSALLGAALGVASPTKVEDAQESLIDLSDGPSTASNLEDEFAALSMFFNCLISFINISFLPLAKSCPFDSLKKSP